ncbi:MAG: RNA-binding protein [Alphaproteobacteria bacterium]|nr:RNA-binding protein [Alphaproteobacteria bacterium]
MWVRNNKGNVFVGNLPPDFSDERLAEAFDPFGIVLSAVVARDPETGAKLRYGFVDIATDKAAGVAISALDGTKVDGCKLNVKARDKPVKKPPSARGPRRLPPRSVTATRMPPRDYDDDAAPPRRAFTMMDAPTRTPLARPSQSQMARQDLPEIEPPPRQDFEVVRRPVRRKEPSFQVERRPLARRIALPDKSS